MELGFDPLLSRFEPRSLAFQASLCPRDRQMSSTLRRTLPIGEGFVTSEGIPSSAESASRRSAHR
jgi:hypothetical protein